MGFTFTGLNEHREILSFCRQHWVNSSFCDSGSLLPLEDLHNLHSNEKDAFWRRAIESFNTSPEADQLFRRQLSNLIDCCIDTQADIALKDVQYIYGGRGIDEFNFQVNMALGDWWTQAASKENKHKTEPKFIDECFEADGRLPSVSGFIRRSWHNGLMVIHGDCNHRIGNIAQILRLNPEMNPVYRAELRTYTLQQPALELLLDQHSAYIAIKEDRADNAPDIFEQMSRALDGQHAYCLKLTEEFERYSLTKNNFHKYVVRLYFLKKTMSNFFLRRYLDGNLNKNNVVREILQNKSIDNK